MRYECPGNSKYTGKTLERTAIELGQFPVITLRQVVANFSKLFIDNVEIIDQPLGCGGDFLPLSDGLSQRPVRFKQDPAVFAYARSKRAALLRLADGLGGGKTFRVLLQTIGAE